MVVWFSQWKLCCGVSRCPLQLLPPHPSTSTFSPLAHSNFPPIVNCHFHSPSCPEGQRIQDLPVDGFNQNDSIYEDEQDRPLGLLWKPYPLAKFYQSFQSLYKKNHSKSHINSKKNSKKIRKRIDLNWLKWKIIDWNYFRKTSCRNQLFWCK